MYRAGATSAPRLQDREALCLPDLEGEHHACKTTMEGDDPYSWTVEQVCTFFQDGVQVLLNSIPGKPQLPALPPFLEALKDNDVSGFVLLSSVGTSDLRDEFGVRSFGQRSTILHCINKLRERSSAYNKQNELKQSPQIEAKQSLDTEEKPADVAPAFGQASPSDTLVAEQPSPGPVRPGEHQIQDRQGRKRRRLNLTAEPAAAPSTPPPGSEGGYFGTASLPIDDLFFSKTLLGRQIEHAESAEFTILDTDRSNDSVEHNFEFHASSNKATGEVQYVYRQIHRFLQQEPIELVRHGHRALASLPYREELSRVANKVQSAVVVHFTHDGDTPVAMRENVAYLKNGGDYNGIAQDSTIGQYDYLNEKYGGGEQKDVSVTESMSSAMNAEIEAEWQSELAEVAASQAKKLTKEDVEELIDEIVQGFIHQWNASRRPRKEQAHAWSVWKKMKGSKARRLGLIEEAKANIDNYTRRLAQQKSYVIMAECSSREQVVTLGEALKATVTDREEERWKIEVWGRRQEPEHVVRHARQTITTVVTSTGKAIPTLAPEPEDRLSVERALAPQHEEHQEHEDVFTTPQSTPKLVPVEPEDGGFDGSDEASNMDDFVEADSRPLDDPPLDGANGRSQDRNQPEASQPEPSPVHVARDERERSLSRSSSLSVGEVLPGMETFFTQRTPKKKSKKTQNNTPKDSFQKPSEPASASRPKATAVIDISSDSASTPKTNSARGGRRKSKLDTFQNSSSNSKPENSSVRDVDSWNLETLIHDQDRKRIVIKLLREQGQVALFAIKALWLKKMMVAFKEDMMRLLSTLRDASKWSDAPPGPLLQSARLAIVWSCLRPEVMKGTYPEEIDWNAVDHDANMFVPFFGILMQKSDGRLFAEQSSSPSPTPTKQSKSDIIEIPSDSEDVVETPHSRRKRKRKVQYSQQATESQHVAMERQNLYKAAETQSSNAQQLGLMVDSGSMLLPIDLLKADQRVHYIHPAVAPKMKEHQINGVRFMWRELTAGAETEDECSGCVLAHAMGLGKTMQTITLLVAVIEAAQSKDPLISSQLPRSLRPAGVAHEDRNLRVLVLCPPSLLDNWRREIQQWANRRLGDVFTVESANKTTQIDILRNWHTFGGVLLMGYTLFSKRVNRTKADEKAGVPDPEGPQLDEFLLQSPEILVADEAHTVKNIGAGVSIAVNRINTRSRIALTGTPMSNDVGEMYALISFAAPGFLGGHIEFKAKFGEPIQNGTYADSSSYEQRRSKVKLATLSRLIEPKIHRADITALKGTLQPKVEFVVTLHLTDLQRSVYNKYLEALLGGGRNREASQVTIFSWLSLLGLLTNHPLAFKRKLNEAKKPRKNKSGKSNTVDGGEASPIPVDDDSAEGVDYEEEGVKTLGFSEETVRHITEDIEDSADPHLSAKMHILTDILELSARCGDKVLIFSSSIPTLGYIGDLLRARGTRFGLITGGVPSPKRPQIIADLTDGRTDVLLISTKAGGVGLNIQAANRVVIMDFGFNPAHEEQAIGRAYRFGQPKPVFVYRLIAGGTFEDNIYNKQLFKTSLTQRVVDKKNPRRNAARSTRSYLYEPNEVVQQDLTEWVGKDPDVFDQLLEHQLAQDDGIGMIRKLTTIETLQREGDDPPLNAEELRQAEEEYQLSIAQSMGPRGQVANMENVPAFVAAQARQNLAPRGPPSTQQAGPSRLMVDLTLPSQRRQQHGHPHVHPHAHPHGHPPASTAPVSDTRPKQTIRMVNSITQRGSSQNIPNGLPVALGPQDGPSSR